MNQQSEHLSSAQVEEYGTQASGAGPETAEWVEKHLADCPSCRARVLEFQRAQFALLLDPKVNTVPTADCPSEDDLRNLAAGLCSEPIAQKLKAHAATCDHCGPLLQEYTEDFSDNFTPEEQAALDQLSSASPKWQRQRARKMLQQARQHYKSNLPEHFRRFFSWKWLMVPATAAVLLIPLGLWYLQRDTPEKAEKYLAQAYTEQRMMEMRWPGAAWAPVRETRGPENSRFSKPVSLRQATEIVDKYQADIPSDVRWLRAKAETEILDGKPDSAITTLSHAPKTQSDSDQLTMDSAIAFFERSVRTGSREDLEEAISLLKLLVERDKTNREALFNLATAYGQRGDWNEAIAAWNTYLQLDREGLWAQEAKEKRDLAQLKIR